MARTFKSPSRHSADRARVADARKRSQRERRARATRNERWTETAERG